MYMCIYVCIHIYIYIYIICIHRPTLRLRFGGRAGKIGAAQRCWLRRGNQVGNLKIHGYLIGRGFNC